MFTQTLLKTLSYGITHMGVAIAVAYILSGSWTVAFAIGLVEPCIQTIVFFFHEKAWHRFEKRHHQKDYHDSVIDSVSPAGEVVEKFLRHHEKGHHK